MHADLTALLQCQSCGSELSVTSDSVKDALRCRTCGGTVPIIRGIPRFVATVSDATARHTQASFGYEWTHFNDWEPSGETNINEYFQGIDLDSLRRATVLDAGCGMGRHARQVAKFARYVVAMDFSMAIDQAARNTAALDNVDCVQADLLELPFRDDAFDFVYSLGVLHHLAETEKALHHLIRKLKPGGKLRVYLYWKRHGWQGALLQLVTATRRLTTRMPFPALRALCRVLSVALFGGVVLPYRALSAAGVRGLDDWPLFVYSKYPFDVLYNDQFDRFSAPIEKRYDAEDVRALLERAGLRDVRVVPSFGWLADGTKPV